MLIGFFRFENEMSFSYERMATKTQFEEEAKVINGLLTTTDILGRNSVSFDAHSFFKQCSGYRVHRPL